MSTATFESLVSKVIAGGITPLIGLFFALAFFMFIWGLLQYFFSGGDVAARKKATSFIFWGIIFLAAMFSIWGLVSIVKNFFFPGNLNQPPNIPFFPGS